MATNHTLQRSSYSFRRQGSSGRIWDDNYFTKSCELRTPRKLQESNNHVTKSCELPIPRKVRQSRFSCELNKTQRQPSMSLQRQPSATLQRQPSIPLQRQSSVPLQRQPSIPLQPPPSRKQRIQKARPRRCECLAFFTQCVR